MELACFEPLRRLVCGMFLPQCSPQGGVLQPCRSVCSSAEKQCSQALDLFSFSWPFNCHLLPDSQDPMECSVPWCFKHLKFQLFLLIVLTLLTSSSEDGSGLHFTQLGTNFLDYCPLSLWYIKIVVAQLLFKQQNVWRSQIKPLLIQIPSKRIIFLISVQKKSVLSFFFCTIYCTDVNPVKITSKSKHKEKRSHNLYCVISLTHRACLYHVST